MQKKQTIAFNFSVLRQLICNAEVLAGSFGGVLQEGSAAFLMHPSPHRGADRSSVRVSRVLSQPSENLTLTWLAMPPS